MEIIAHRGFWHTVEEKNSIIAIKRAFKMGFGVETDLRDYAGHLVISHDIADRQSPFAEEMFKEYCNNGCKLQLALNVKADGIQPLLRPLLQKYSIGNYFLFDMSVPELVVNVREKLRFYTRHSDIETECVMYNKAAGIWLDSFYSNVWISIDIVKKHLRSGKAVCVVSPELHGCDPISLWRQLLESGLSSEPLITLCSDRPQEASDFFHE